MHRFSLIGRNKMDYFRVCAIDAGTRNFAFCVLDNNNWREPLVWQREDLWAPAKGKRSKPTKQNMLEITYEWCQRNQQMLRECDLIILENQIRTPFIIMNTVINSLYYTRVRSVSPMTIAAYFKFPTTREKKKAATVKFVNKHASFPVDNGKQDDYADAWCMAMHAMIKRGALSREELDFSEIDKPKKC